MNESKVPETASQAECAQPADTESTGLAIDIDGPKCSDFDDPKSHDISDEAIVFDASSHPDAPSNDSFEIPTINVLCETLPQLSSQENVQEILPAAHERTVDVPVDINDYHSHKLASSLVEQVLDVPELLDEGSTEIGTNGKPVFDIPRPTSPSTPILGQSPVVKILSDDLVLDSDTFSLSVSTIYSASTQSNVAVVDIENKQGTTSDNDYPTSIAEGQLRIEEPVALGTPIKEGITSEGDLPTPVVDDYTIAEHPTPIHYSLYHSTEQNVFGGSVAVKKKVCGPAKVYIAVPDHIFKKKSSQITNLEANPVITRATIMVASKIKTKSKKKKKPTNGQQQSLGSPVLPQPSEKDFLNTQHILNKSPPFTIQEAVSKPVSEGHKTPTPATEHSLPVSEENTTGSGLSDCPEFKEIVLTKDDINASSEAELVDCSSKPEVKESSTLVPISIRTTADPSNTSEPTKESSTLISEEKRIFVAHPYASQYPAELSIPIANQRFGPTISEDGLFIEDANIQGRGLKKKSTTFVDRVQQFSEKSCSQNSSRRSSGSEFLVQTQAGHSKSYSLSSSDAMSRRKSQIRAGSFEDQVRQMLISSQDSPKLPSQLVSPNNQPAPNLPPSNATIPVDWMTTHCHGQFGSQSQYRVHPGQSNHKYHVAQVTAYPLLHPGPPPPFFNSSDYPPCHQAIFHHEPSIGEEHGYFGSSKVPAELNAIVQKVPIASITFQCNTCNKHLSDHNSIICPMCGINSHTRFCDEECRYASGFHWKCCGINSLPYQTDHVVPPYNGPWRTTGSMNVYRFWHPTILYDYPGFDFLIFDDGLIYNESPKILRAIIFSEQPLRDRFHAVYKRAVWDFDEFCVRLLWRVVRAWLKVCYWEDITIELLSRQFELEFGPGWINSRNGDLPENFPTEEEWAKVE